MLDAQIFAFTQPHTILPFCKVLSNKLYNEHVLYSEGMMGNKPDAIRNIL